MEHLGTLILAVAGLLTTLTGYIGLKTKESAKQAKTANNENKELLQELQTAIDQINNAVNHVLPGQLPLTQRVDRIDEALIVLQFDQNSIKTEVTGMSEKVDSANTMAEELLKAHVHTQEKIDELIRKIPKRKND